MGGKKPLRRPLWPPTRATASNYYPLGLDGAGGAAKPLLRAPKKPAPLHGRLPAFSGAVDAFERARKCFLEWRYFFSIILSEFLKNRVALQQRMCVSSSFSEWKRFKERSVHSHFSSAFHDRGAPRRGRTPQLNCIKPSQEYSKKRDSRMCFLLTQDALCDSRGTHSAIFFLS